MTVGHQRSQFRQLADLLRQAIEAGEYPAGGQLPSEEQLAGRYGVDRRTVNQALRMLRAEGLVRVARGRGTIVRTIPVLQRSVPARYAQAVREGNEARGPFDGELRSAGLVTRSEVEVSQGAAPPDVAAALGLADGAEVVIRHRDMYAADEPVMLSVSYIPAGIAAGTPMAEADSGPGGIISRFAEAGYAQVRITETVRWRRPEDHEEDFLQLDAGQAVVEIWHTGYTAEGRAVEINRMVAPAHLWALTYEVPLS